MTLDEVRAHAHADALGQMADGQRAPESVVGVINRALRPPWTQSGVVRMRFDWWK